MNQNRRDRDRKIGLHAMRMLVVLSAALLSSCGGGGGDGGSTPVAEPPSAQSLKASCVAPRSPGSLDPRGRPYGDRQGTLADEQRWLRSWIDESYLWYRDVRNLSAATLDPQTYLSAESYFVALKSPLITASGKPKDQFHFYYDTPSWVALSQSGITQGYGFTIALVARTPPRKAVVAYTDPNTVASAANIGRGAQILTVDGVDLVNDGSSAAVAVLNAGLFPHVAGAHTFTVLDTGSSTPRTVTLNAGPVTSTPVQNVKRLPAPNQSVGYLLFNDHIATSEQLLVTAINQLSQPVPVTDLVLDLRYNGGGYLDIASELAYMIAGPTQTDGKVFEQLSFNDKNPFALSVAQRTTPFHAQGQGFSTPTGQALPFLGLTHVYVLVGPGTCSASESVVNGLRGAGVRVDLIGGTTCGKPYGFYATDNCNTTYFAIQFQGVNHVGFGDYADGFAPTCSAADDFNHALGDPGENQLAAALSFRATGVCLQGVGRARGLSATAAATAAAAEPVLVRSPMRENRIYRSR